MRKTYAAKLRIVLSASIASGRLSEDLNELSEAELEFITHDWELWARDEQLPPPPHLVIPGEPSRETRDPELQVSIEQAALGPGSSPGSAPGSAGMTNLDAASSALGGRLDEE